MISKVLHVLNPYLIFPYTYNLLCKRYVMLRNTFLYLLRIFLNENSPKNQFKWKNLGELFCDQSKYQSCDQNKDHMT